MQSMQGWKNKLGAIVKGPSWLPGKPWTGADEDKIDVSNHTFCEDFVINECLVKILLMKRYCYIEFKVGIYRTSSFCLVHRLVNAADLLEQGQIKFGSKMSFIQIKQTNFYCFIVQIRFLLYCGPHKAKH